MGPHYFNTHINDLVYNNEFECYLFADDTNFLKSENNINDLEKTANIEFSKAQKFMEANELSLNLEKTQFMLFIPKKSGTQESKFELKSGNHKFKEVNEISQGSTWKETNETTNKQAIDISK